jgi:hypothetical protein
MHQNALCDPQVTPDAKTQVWHNVSWRALRGVRTGTTQAQKIVQRHFTPQMQHNGLRDPKTTQDAKTQVWLMCPGTLFVKSVPIPPVIPRF